MKVAITGATGFLGGKAAATFHRLGMDVIALGRDPQKIQALQQRGLKAFVQDLSEKEKLLQSFKDVEVVVHCAALSSPWGPYADFYRANVEGTRNVLEACTTAKVRRLVHLSTPSIYVEKTDRSMIKESDPLPKHSINHYAATKLLAEKEVLNAKGRLEVLILRPQAIVGEGDRSIFPRLLRLGKKGFLPVVGMGKNKIDLTCVENVVEAIRLTLTAPKEAVGGIYNITNDEPVALYPTLRGVFETLKFDYKERPLSFEKAYFLGSLFETLYRPFPGKEPVLTRYAACVLGRERTLDISKAKTLLGYRPILSVQEGLNRFLESFRE